MEVIEVASKKSYLSGSLHRSNDNNAIEISEGRELPTGVRIIALIKLGVESISQISSYLNISQNTIYVYRAKIKAKTIVPKDEFDDYIKRIDQIYITLIFKRK